MLISNKPAVVFGIHHGPCKKKKEKKELRRQPRRLRTDKGLEFQGHAVQRMLNRRGVLFFTAQHSTKASLSIGMLQSHAEREIVSLFHGHQCAQVPTRVGGLGPGLQSHCPQHHENKTHRSESS